MKSSFDQKKPQKTLNDASDSIAEKGFLFQKMIFSLLYKPHLSVETNYDEILSRAESNI